MNESAWLVGDAELELVLAQLCLQSGIDLRDYGPATLRRRVSARAAAVGAADLREYARHLETKPGEGKALLEAVLVNVTHFDRDPPVWAALGANVLPALARESSKQQRPLRAWSAGCAHGQEVWSLAMRLAAACGGRFELFATDLDEVAVASARQACYRRTELAGLPAGYLELWFDLEDGHARPKAGLQEQVRFEVHDLAGQQLAPAGAVLAQFDLILCRNVLIYLQPRLRDLCVRRFAGMLRPGGVLVLGCSESLTAETAGLFTPFGGTRTHLQIHCRNGVRP